MTDTFHELLRESRARSGIPDRDVRTPLAATHAIARNTRHRGSSSPNEDLDGYLDAHDGHPTPLLNRKVAEALADALASRNAELTPVRNTGSFPPN